MNSWHGYPSIYNLGHRYIGELLTVPVVVEEKVDGSQFSFGLDEDGEILARSKGAVLCVDAPEKMFRRAVEAVKERVSRMRVGWTYRAEYLARPKHNSLAYDWAPKDNLIVFDVNTAEATYLSWEEKSEAAAELGLEVVPKLYEGMLGDINFLRGLLELESILGGPKIEGVVVKQCVATLFGADKKALMGKFVSEGFKEVHRREWKITNPSSSDIISEIGVDLKTPARWAKGVLHLRERGLIEDSPRDIGKLVKEVPEDIRAEMEGEIKDRLFGYAWPKISRIVVGGLAEWYKEELLKRQFDAKE